MQLCFGTYCTALSACLTPYGDTKALCKEIFNALLPSYGVVERDVSSKCAGGKGNLPNIILDEAAGLEESMYPDIVRRFQDRVVKLIEQKKRKEAVLALIDIIRQDDADDETVFDVINNMTKGQIVNLKEIVLGSFLAGLFLYTCQTSNSGMQKYVKEITPEYVHGFASQGAYISFVGSYSAASIDVTRSIGADSVALALVAEAEGNCLNCGRKIATLEGTVGNDFSARVSLGPGDDAVLCVECARKFHSFTHKDIQRLREKKKSFHIRSVAREAMSKHSLSDEIRQTLLKVSKMQSSPETRLKEKPTKVENKVKDEDLKDLILGRVTRKYKGVNDILYQLSGENLVVMDDHAKIIRRMYEDARYIKGLDQRGIFDELVNTICSQTSGDLRTAAETVVSYFVQRCEVYDETPEQGNPLLTVGDSQISANLGNRVTEGYNAKDPARRSEHE